METKDLLQIRKEHLYPTLIPYYKEPICLTKAKGSLVWDSDGKEYLDLIGGIVTISVGHNHPRIVKKTREMLDNNAPQHTSFIYLTGLMEKLAAKLAEVAPKGLTKCYFTNSGSEANEMAVLSARVATNEQMVVSLKHGYHGGTNVTMSLCGHGTWKFRGQPQTAVVYAAEPYCYRCPFGATRGNCNFECAQDIKNVIETTTHGKVAAFIAEPIQGVGGFIDPPVEYFKRACEIVRSFGGKYISDEVQTGSGRLGKYFFAIEEAGVVPDIITTAKGFGNGAPIGAVIAKSEIADAMAGKAHFNTFGGDPYQAMQAAETMDIIHDEKLIANAALMGKYLNEGFLALQNEFPLIGDVRGRGLCVGLELVKDRKTKEHATAELMKLMETSKSNGLLLGKGGLRGNIIRIAPPMNITRAECDTILAKMRKSLSEVK